MRSGRPDYGSAIEGVGDILVFAASHQTQRDTVDECFSILTTAVEALFRLRERSEEEFFTKAINPRYLDRPAEDVGFALWMLPDETLRGFTLPMEQVRRGLEAALAIGNDYVTDKAMEWLDAVLERLTSSPRNEHLIRATLRQYAEVLRTTADMGQVYQKTHAASDWFYDVVFRMPLYRQSRFRLEYLDIVSDSVFQTMRWMISAGEQDVFVGFCAAAVDSVAGYPQGSDIHEVWQFLFRRDRAEYDELQAATNLDELMSYVRASEEGCVDTQTVDEVALRLRRFYDAACPSLAEADSGQLKAMLRGVLERLEHLARVNRLEELTFSLAAYCLALEKQDYIRRLLEYNNPPGTTAVSVNRDPLPTSAPKLLKSYLQCWSARGHFDHFQAHLHGEGFKRRLLVDLLARAIGPARPTDGAAPHLSVVTKIQGPNETSKTSAMGYEAERLAELASSLAAGEPDSLLIANGSTEDARQALRNAAAALTEVQEDTASALELVSVQGHVDASKVQEFQQEVMRSFMESSGLRTFFDQNPSVYVEEELEIPRGGSKFGSSIFGDKAAFFRNWHVHYMGYGESFGRALAHDEEARVIGPIRARCKAADGGSFERFLGQLPDNASLAAFASPLISLHPADGTASFTPNWMVPEKNLSPHIEGWLQLGTGDVPVFRILGLGEYDGIIVVDVDSLGRFVQSSPLSEGDDPDSLVGFLQVAVTEVDDDQELFDNTLAVNPDWLQARPASLSAEDFLKTKVWLRVFERFTLELGEDFRGWCYEFVKPTDSYDS